MKIGTIDLTQPFALAPMAGMTDTAFRRLVKRRVEFQKYLVRLRAQAIIEWKNDEVKKAYEAGLAVANTTPAVPPAR